MSQYERITCKRCDGRLDLSPIISDLCAECRSLDIRQGVAGCSRLDVEADRISELEAENTRLTQERAEAREIAGRFSESFAPDIHDLCYTVDRLRAALISLKAEPMGNDEWGIKCIEDHNAIIDEALGGAPEPPNNDSEIARLAREYARAHLAIDGNETIDVIRAAEALAFDYRDALIAAVEQEGS